MYDHLQILHLPVSVTVHGFRGSRFRVVFLVSIHGAAELGEIPNNKSLGQT
jgi:hypothetical protein